ncbi:PEGA domain-containing protein [Patescibacteria group bacterium]|nr:PEGA domain-containing protein [Patescibacteria group bacterium]MBU1922530.1 PEGA domain-containing protein [Patescibacteria group bacterium]
MFQVLSKILTTGLIVIIFSGCSLDLRGVHFVSDTSEVVDALPDEPDMALDAPDAREDIAQDDGGSEDLPMEDGQEEEVEDGEFDDMAADTAEDDVEDDIATDDVPAEDGEEDAAEDPIEDEAEEELPPTCIDVDTVPSGALVELDGMARGNTPLIICGLEAGTHALQLKKTDYYLARRDVEVVEFETVEVRVDLDAVIISCTPTDEFPLFWEDDITEICYPVTLEYGIVYGLPRGPHRIVGHDLGRLNPGDPYSYGFTAEWCNLLYLHEYSGETLIHEYTLWAMMSCP